MAAIVLPNDGYDPSSNKKDVDKRLDDNDTGLLDMINPTWGPEPNNLRDVAPQLSCFRKFPKDWQKFKYEENLALNQESDIGHNIYYFDNLLSKDECLQYISTSEEFGYTSAKDDITKIGQLMIEESKKTGIKLIWPPIDTVRTNKRLIWQVEEFESKRLFDRLLNILPQQFKKLTFDYQQENENENKDKKGDDKDTDKDEDEDLIEVWELKRLNPRFRFFKYDKNDVFKSHLDAPCAASIEIENQDRDETENKNSNEDNKRESIYQRSYLTVVIYLNDDFKGGQTLFDQKRNDDGDNSNNSNKKDKDKDKENGENVSISPKQGSVLVFFHDGIDKNQNRLTQRHCASAPKDGVKYIIRSDLMYQQVKK